MNGKLSHKTQKLVVTHYRSLGVLDNYTYWKWYIEYTTNRLCYQR